MLRLSSNPIWARLGPVVGPMMLATTLALLAGTSQAAAGETEIHVRIDNVRNSSGRLFVALYDGKRWLKPGHYLSAQKVKAKRGVVRATFRGMPRGVYGLAVFHDENMNSRVDTNFIGLPKEGYGFSRVTPRRKPSFTEVAFSLGDKTTSPIRLRY